MGEAARALALREFSVEVFESRISSILARFSNERAAERERIAA